MNKRQVDLLKKLIVQDGYQPLKYFSDAFNISGKTISKDLDEVENIINPIGAYIERKQGSGIRLYYTPSQLERLNIILNDAKVFDGNKDLEHRRTEILLNLLINTNKCTTIQKLSDKYMVSRTSINNDLNEIRKSLDKYNLELSRTLKGTRIVGSEINIRKAWVFTIQEYGKINPDYIMEYQNIRHKELNINEIGGILNVKSVSFFENLLNELENKLKLVIYEPYYTNLLSHLVIMTKRIIDGNYIDDKAGNKDSVLSISNELYNSAVYLIKEIEKKFDIKISKEEVAYIYKYLISIGLSFDDNKKGIKGLDPSYIHFTKGLIDIISQMSEVNYNLRIGLYDNLSLHIRPMLNRIRYNIQIKNPLLKDFLKEFKEEFFVVKIACFLICKKYGFNMINDDEVAYILSYFISEDEKIAETVKIKTVVICHSGYGTSQLLATRLKNAFNNIEISGIVSSNSINKIDLSKVDLIVSTVDFDIDQSYLMVSAFLNEIDRENIKNYIEGILRNKRKSFLKDDMKEISIETIGEKNDIKRPKKFFIEEKLIHIEDNTYVCLTGDRKNSIREYLPEKNRAEKHIIFINYSDYIYLSKAVRLLIRKRL